MDLLAGSPAGVSAQCTLLQLVLHLRILCAAILSMRAQHLAAFVQVLARGHTGCRQQEQHCRGSLCCATARARMVLLAAVTPFAWHIRDLYINNLFPSCAMGFCREVHW